MRKYQWSLLKTLEFLNSRRPDLEIRATFIQQLAAYENRLTKKGLGPKSSKWSEIADDACHLQSEELLLRNTFLNAQMGPIAQFHPSLLDPNFIKKNKIDWIDKRTLGKKDLASEGDPFQDLCIKTVIEPITIHKERNPEDCKTSMKINSVDPWHSLKTTVQGAQMIARQESEKLAKNELDNQKLTKQVVVPQPVKSDRSREQQRAVDISNASEDIHDVTQEVSHNAKHVPVMEPVNNINQLENKYSQPGSGQHSKKNSSSQQELAAPSSAEVMRRTLENQHLQNKEQPAAAQPTQINLNNQYSATQPTNVTNIINNNNIYDRPVIIHKKDDNFCLTTQQEVGSCSHCEHCKKLRQSQNLASQPSNQRQPEPAVQAEPAPPKFNPGVITSTVPSRTQNQASAAPKLSGQVPSKRSGSARQNSATVKDANSTIKQTSQERPGSASTREQVKKARRESPKVKVVPNGQLTVPKYNGTSQQQPGGIGTQSLYKQIQSHNQKQNTRVATASTQNSFGSARVGIKGQKLQSFRGGPIRATATALNQSSNMNQTVDVSSSQTTSIRPSSSKPLKATFNSTDQSLKNDLANAAKTQATRPSSASKRPNSPGTKQLQSDNLLKIKGRQRSASPGQNTQTTVIKQSSVVKGATYGAPYKAPPGISTRIQQVVGTGTGKHVPQMYMRGYSPSKPKWKF